MGRPGRRRKRQRGQIEERPSGSLRVRVYAGIDPVSKRRLYLEEHVPKGPQAEKEAERVLTRLLNQVDERRAPKTSASLDKLLDQHLEMLDVDPSTRRDYKNKLGKHVRPVLGATPAARIEVETLESLYAELRRCKDHCRRTRLRVDRRTPRPHICDEHGDVGPCKPFDPDCRSCRRMCKPHHCRPLGDSTIGTIHWVLSGAFDDAVRWDWFGAGGVNPADLARKPPAPKPKPDPPSVQDAARLADEAWSRGLDWGAFVWIAMTTGARRGEMCALRWSDVDLDSGVIDVERAIEKDEDGRWIEKDTKSHQHRRVVLDPEAAAVLQEHLARANDRARSIGAQLAGDAFVFSLSIDGSTFLIPDTATQRYDRMADRMGIKTTLHKLRHYSATELLNAGVNVRTVAGRLGHAGGGATTLKVYTAWLAEADQRPAPSLSGRMPARSSSRGSAERVPEGSDGVAPAARDSGPYVGIARDLRGAIACGILLPGDCLPAVKEVAERYGVAVGTAHRAITVLKQEGLVSVSRGKRAVVARASGEIPTGSGRV